MTDGDNGTISTDSASGRLSQGSDAVINMRDLLPHVVMDAPPAQLADELDRLAENPYMHFEVAPYEGGALNYVVGKEDPVTLRAAAASEGLGPRGHVVEEGYESWINRKAVRVETAEGESDMAECDGLRVACAETEYGGIAEYLRSVGFWVFAPDELERHYSYVYSFGGTPLRHVAEGLASNEELLNYETRLVEERLATGRWARSVYVAGQSNQALPDLTVTVNGVGRMFKPRSVVGVTPVTAVAEKAIYVYPMKVRGQEFHRLMLGLSRTLATMARTNGAPRITGDVDCFSAARAAGAQMANVIQEMRVQYDSKGKWAKALASFTGPTVGRVEVGSGGAK